MCTTHARATTNSIQCFFSSNSPHGRRHNCKIKKKQKKYFILNTDIDFVNCHQIFSFSIKLNFIQ